MAQPMRDQDNVQVVQAVYEAFGRGDFAAVLSSLADDIAWHVAGPDYVPTAGTRRGRDHVAQLFETAAETWEFEQFEPRGFIAQGDKVVVLGYARSTAKSTGRTIETDWVHLFTMQAGKVTEFRGFEDTAAVAAAFRKP